MAQKHVTVEIPRGRGLRNFQCTGQCAKFRLPAKGLSRPPMKVLATKQHQHCGQMKFYCLSRAQVIEDECLMFDDKFSLRCESYTIWSAWYDHFQEVMSLTWHRTALHRNGTTFLTWRMFILISQSVYWLLLLNSSPQQSNHSPVPPKFCSAYKISMVSGMRLL